MDKEDKDDARNLALWCIGFAAFLTLPFAPFLLVVGALVLISVSLD
jgi:hypothetical protein